MVAAEQRGVDLELQVLSKGRGPIEATRLPPIDSPTGREGIERIYLLAAGGWGLGGGMTFSVTAPDRSAPAGRYVLRIETLRAATAVDRRRTRAEWSFARAEAARRQEGEATLRRAAAGYRAVLGEFSALDDPIRRADALDRLGRTLARLGDIAGSRRAFAEAVEIFRRERGAPPRPMSGPPDPPPETPGGLADALNGLGLAYRLLGDPDAAARCYEEALAIQRHAGRRFEQGVSLTNLGRALADRDRSDRAFAAYDEALAIWTEIGDSTYRGVTLANRGRLRLKLGDLDAARRDLLAACRDLAGRSRELGAALLNLGESLILAGRRGEAREVLDRALAIGREVGDRHGEAIALGQLGLLAEAAGDLEAAASIEGQAVDRYVELGDAAGETSGRIVLCRIETRRGRPREALAQILPALRLAREGTNREAEAAALTGLARAQWRSGDLTAAADAARAARAIVESLRRDLAPRGLAAAFFGSRRELWDLSVGIAMARHRAAPRAGFEREAFALAETGRARGLLEALEAPRGPTETAAGSCPEEATRLAETVRALNAASAKAAWLADNRAPAAAREEAGAEVDRLLEARERSEAACRRRAFGPPSRGASPAPALPRLAPGTELIAYSLGERESFAWRLAGDRLEVRALPPRAALEALARRAHALVASPQPSLARTATRTALAELSARLLFRGPAPVGGTPLRRLLFVPEGALFYVPFAALPLADGEPLVERAEVAVLPSVAALAALRGARSRSSGPRRVGDLVVFADPVYSSGDPRLPRTAGSPSPSRSPALPRLPGTAREAAAILALAGGSGHALVGFDANMESLLAGRFSGARYLHFATHALLDPDRPALSAIALSAFDAEGRPREGRLKAYEIQRLRLGADLVVLSGCETGAGREREGEGLASLAQSFLIAGARASVQSLYRVDDETTADLMTAFYRGLVERGESPATALRAAQREMRGRPGRGDLRHWAGFVVFGDPDG